MGISGVVACNCRLGGGGGGHVARPEVAESVYLWSYKKVNVFYIVEIGIDI